MPPECREVKICDFTNGIYTNAFEIFDFGNATANTEEITVRLQIIINSYLTLKANRAIMNIR